MDASPTAKLCITGFIFGCLQVPAFAGDETIELANEKLVIPPPKMEGSFTKPTDNLNSFTALTVFSGARNGTSAMVYFVPDGFDKDLQDRKIPKSPRLAWIERFAEKGTTGNRLVFSQVAAAVGRQLDEASKQGYSLGKIGDDAKTLSEQEILSQALKNTPKFLFKTKRISSEIFGTYGGSEIRLNILDRNSGAKVAFSNVVMIARDRIFQVGVVAELDALEWAKTTSVDWAKAIFAANGGESKVSGPSLNWESPVPETTKKQPLPSSSPIAPGQAQQVSSFQFGQILGSLTLLAILISVAVKVFGGKGTSKKSAKKKKRIAPNESGPEPQSPKPRPRRQGS